MNRFRGILLASDFDATLTDRDGKIPEANTDSIKYFISEGGRFTVSTGRTAEGFHKYDPSFINAPVMVSNGAMAYDYGRKEVVFADAMELDSLNLLKMIEEKYKGMCIELFTVDKGAYVLNPDEITFGHFIGLQYNFTQINTITEDIFPLIKVMLGVREKTMQVQEYLENISLGNTCYIPCTGSYVELMNKKAGKGNGLMKLASILGIDSKNVYAVGDGANDADMLKAAATGFAPSNADPIALKNADKIVCDNNQGSVAGVIEYLSTVYR